MALNSLNVSNYNRLHMLKKTNFIFEQLDFNNLYKILTFFSIKFTFLTIYNF